MPQLRIEIEKAIEQRQNAVDQVATPCIQHAYTRLIGRAAARRAHRPLIAPIALSSQPNVTTLQGHKSLLAEEFRQGEINGGESIENTRLESLVETRNARVQKG